MKQKSPLFIYSYKIICLSAPQTPANTKFQARPPPPVQSRGSGGTSTSTSTSNTSGSGSSSGSSGGSLCGLEVGPGQVQHRQPRVEALHGVGVGLDQGRDLPRRPGAPPLLHRGLVPRGLAARDATHLLLATVGQADLVGPEGQDGGGGGGSGGGGGVGVVSLSGERSAAMRPETPPDPSAMMTVGFPMRSRIMHAASAP